MAEEAKIRTRGTVAGTVVFKTTALDHSATLPEGCHARKRRDLNSRYRCRYVRFRNGCLKPLGHVSAHDSANINH